MRIGIIGSDKIFSIERFYVHYLREEGLDVQQFVAPVIFQDYYRRSLWNRILFRIGLSGIYHVINQQVKEWIKEIRPDVLWVFKGMELLPSTLQWAKDQGIRLVNYNPDHPFFFSGSGSGNKNITRAVNIYDLHFTYHEGVRDALLQKNLRVAMLPFGHEVSVALYDTCAAMPEIISACFLGNPDRARAAFLTSLADRGIALAIYGHGWKKFVQHPRITVHQAVYGEEQWKVLGQYRVQINLMRPHNERSHNMRTFEVPAVGGIMVAPDTPEHRLFFVDQKEAFFFRDVEQAVAIIKEVLAFPVEVAVQIRKAARERSVQSAYDYKSRARQAWTEIQKMYA